MRLSPAEASVPAFEGYSQFADKVVTAVEQLAAAPRPPPVVAART